jgi:Coenzyme PQQ synthesis protein D (PqqD)
MNATTWLRNDHWVGTQIDDAFVMLDFEGGTYVSLNKTATDVWNALEQPSSAENIVGVLTERYDVSGDQCAAAVDRVLADFQAKRLIQPVE